MIFKEFGAENENVMIFLHGGGLSWWNYRDEAEMLKEKYHVILPVLNGHAGSDRPFTSIESNADEIISFIDDNFSGSVMLIGGLSLGGQILLEILTKRKDICRHALVESAMVIPQKLTNTLVGPAFGSSYGLIKNKSFAKLQFKSLHMREELFDDYYRDSCGISKEDMIAFMKANTAYSLKDSISDTAAEIHVFAGEKEVGAVKRSAEIIHGKVPGSTLTVLPGLYHGEFSINHPEDYADTVSNVAGG